MVGENKKEIHDVIIIGNGIASKVFLFHLLRHEASLNILVLESPLHSPCSLKTTSHVGLDNPRKGVSVLGDLLVDSFNSFEEFISNERPSGIDKGFHFLDKMEKGRPHYIISPREFLDWFDSKNKKENVTFLKDSISLIDESSSQVVLEGTLGNTYFGKKVIAATGGHFKSCKIKGLEKDFYQGFVQRPGSFWYANISPNFYPSSFVLTVEKVNLVYRKNDNLLLIGGTTQGDGELGVDFKTLFLWHGIFRDIFDLLPRFEEGTVLMGIRFRGPKRMPYFGPLGEKKKIFGIIGLHKNGFSYPFSIAPRMVEKYFKTK